MVCTWYTSHVNHGMVQIIICFFSLSLRGTQVSLYLRLPYIFTCTSAPIISNRLLDTSSQSYNYSVYVLRLSFFVVYCQQKIRSQHWFLKTKSMRFKLLFFLSTIAQQESYRLYFSIFYSHVQLQLVWWKIWSSWWLHKSPGGRSRQFLKIWMQFQAMQWKIFRHQKKIQ